MPTVAVMIPGYGEVAAGAPANAAEPGCGSVSQFSTRPETSCRPGGQLKTEDDVCKHEPDHGKSVAAVPDGEPVEADGALEERQPGEEEHLD